MMRSILGEIKREEEGIHMSMYVGVRMDGGGGERMIKYEGIFLCVIYSLGLWLE